MPLSLFLLRLFCRLRHAHDIISARYDYFFAFASLSCFRCRLIDVTFSASPPLLSRAADAFDAACFAFDADAFAESLAFRYAPY